jgi:hypothetical protein
VVPYHVLQYERASIGPTGAIAANTGVCKGPYDALNGSALAWCAAAASLAAVLRPPLVFARDHRQLVRS